MDTNRVETLIRELDMQREAYINTFQKVHDLLTQNLAASAPSTGLPRSETRSSPQSLSRAVTDPEATLLNSSTEPSSFKASSKSKSTGDDSDPEEDEEIYVQTPLDPRSYDEEGLRNHLRSYSWTPYGRKLLDGVVGNPSRVSAVPLLPTRGQAATDRSFATDCQVFDVGPDGSPLPVEYGHLKPQHGQATVVWNSIKEINPASKQRHAVGRITILREPSPILFGAIHYTMHKDFDVDEIFRHLYEAESSSANLFNRAFDEDPRRQRSFVFNFEYFTLIGENCQPMAWQLAAGQEDRKPGHIAITRCSSVVALVLSGSVIKEIKSPGRRKAKERGPVYDPFSPWQILNIQCYPDLRASTNVHDSTKHYVNGPDAFMSTLLGEFRDARLRFGSITKKISRQVRPPLEFMFDSDLRDKLLFEDNEYSMAKKYFWAHQTLGIMNESIKSMIDSYEENFTREVWEGKHRTLWPLLDQKSPRNAHFRKRMAELKIEFEHEIMNLRKLNKENNDRRKEIEGLREDLFTGTSIQESRKSVNATETTVQQGHNIKVLTMVSIFFLPLTFVTSVFGMTNMPTVEHYWAFGVVTATVCVPFFVLIASLNTNRGMSFWRSRSKAAFNKIGEFFGWLSRGGKASPRLANVKSFESQSSVPMRRWSSNQREPQRQETEEPTSRGEYQRRMEDGLPSVAGLPRPPPPQISSSGIAGMWADERKRRLTYSEDV